MTALGEDVQDIFTGTKTIVYLSKGDKLDEKVITTALAKHKFKPKAITRDDTQIM